MSGDGITMMWAAPLPENKVSVMDGKVKIALFSNEANLDYFLMMNQAMPTSSSTRIAAEEIAKIKDYTDGYAI